jgi:predicted RNase H-like HicB family nuclease
MYRPPKLEPGDTVQLSAVVQEGGKLYVSWCPELDVASQGRSIKTALQNLKEAVELYLEDEDAPPVRGRPLITTIEVADAKAPRAVRA